MTKCRRGIQYLRRARGRDCILSKGPEVLASTTPSEDGVPDSKTRFRHMAMGTLPPASANSSSRKENHRDPRKAAKKDHSCGR